MNRIIAIFFLLPLACFAQRTVLYNSSDFTLYSPSSFWTANSTSISNALSLSVFLTQPEGDTLYQPKDATLTALAGASTGSDTLVYFSAADTAAVTTFTSWGRGLVDDADQAAARVTLGLVPGTDVQAYDADLAAVAGLASNGLLARTSSGNFSTRTITGDSEITVSNGDGVSGNPTLEIASSITRDSELSAYQPLDTVLTRLAGIGSGTEGDILYRDSVGWTNLARGANGYVLTATASTIGWSAPTSGSFDFWTDWTDWETAQWNFVGNTGASSLEPGLAFTAISSGVNSAIAGLSGSGAIGIRTVAGTATGTGGFIHTGGSSHILTNRATQLYFSAYMRTNGAVYRLGFGDSTTTTEPTDALMFTVTNDVVWPVALNNGVKAVAASGYTLQQSIPYTFRIFQTNDFARFIIMSNVVGGSDVEVYNDTIGSGLPLGSSRLTGISLGGINNATANTNGTDVLLIEHLGIRKYKR